MSNVKNKFIDIMNADENKRICCNCVKAPIWLTHETRGLSLNVNQISKFFEISLTANISGHSALLLTVVLELTLFTIW